MKPLLWVCSCLCVVLALLAGVGCTITIGPFEETGKSGDGKTSVLPTPKDPVGEEPPLDDAQQARKKEVEQHIANVIYYGGTIVETVQLPSGDIIDFIDRNTLPAIPYELPPLPFAPEDLVLPEGVEFGLTELEQIPELMALAVTATPFNRPTFWPYILGETDATSIEDYLDRYQLGGQPGGQPPQSEHLLAGLISFENNRGMSGFMNQFRPQVEAGTFSLLEFAVGCFKDSVAQEMVGVVISVDKAESV